MKQLVIGVVVVLVVIGGGYYLYNNQAATGPVDPNSTVATSTAATTTVSVVAGQYNVDPLKSVANWEGRKVILTSWIDQGTIKVASGTATVSEGMIAAGKVVFDMTSITATATGKNGGFDALAKHLKSDDFFNAAKYPTATFVAENITLDPKNSATQNVSGKLTIRDVTKDVVVPVAVMVENGQISLAGSTTVDRTAFSVKYGSGKFFKNLGDNVIADNFTLSFKVYFNQ